MVVRPVSLYYHLPFCRRKCGYCHFYVVPDKEELKTQLLDALQREWQLISPLLDTQDLVSVYFGGGTPSLFAPKRIASLIETISASPAYRRGLELTLEVNPEEATVDLLKAYADAGINRVSIGVQSFDDGLLQLLTRRHSADKAIKAVEAAKAAGIDNISIDLMYEIPGQTLAQWESTLAQAGQLPITHLSLYNLTIEPDTAFFRREKELQRKRPDDQVCREMYQLAQQSLESAGLIQYELSAFARSDLYSRHNLGYWTGRPFLGLGPSAFSYWEGRRFRNVADLTRYCKALEGGELPRDLSDQLAPDAQRRELLVLQLRLRRGLDLAAFEKQHGALESVTMASLDKLQAQNLLCKAPSGRYTLTPEGQLFFDTVAVELI